MGLDRWKVCGSSAGAAGYQLRTHLISLSGLLRFKGMATNNLISRTIRCRSSDVSVISCECIILNDFPCTCLHKFDAPILKCEFGRSFKWRNGKFSKSEKSWFITCSNTSGCTIYGKSWKRAAAVNWKGWNTLACRELSTGGRAHQVARRFVTSWEPLSFPFPPSVE